MRPRTAAVLALAVTGLTGCTSAQIEAWLDWDASDPAAADAFIHSPEAAQFIDDTDAPQFAPWAERQVSGGRWDGIAWCESGGNWHYPPVTNSTGTYSGGLMIWTKAWVAYGGQQFASQAWLASKAEQIEVAERILADRGWRAWDCA